MDLSFVRELAIVLSVGAVTSFLAKLIKQPPIFGFMVAGVIIGPYSFESIAADPHTVHSLSQFAVILVMFSVGLEFRLKKFFDILPISGVTGIIQISTLALAAIFVAKAIGSSTIEALFLATSVAISSTMVISSVFEDHPPEKDTKRYVFGILIIQDIVAIIMLTLLGAMDLSTVLEAKVIFPTGIKLLSVLTFIFAIGIFFIPKVIRKAVSFNDNNLLVVLTMGICFGVSLLVEKSGFSVALGGFLAGMLVAESGESDQIEHLIKPIKNLFLAIFFISIGMTLNIGMAISYLPHAIGLSLLIISLHFIGVGISGILSGNNLRKSIKAGLSLGQIGEFSFLIIGIGVAQGAVRPFFQQIIITTAILTSLITPILWKSSDQILGLIEKYLPQRVRMLITLYENWFDQVRGPKTENVSLEIPKKVVASIAIDSLILILLPPIIVNLFPNFTKYLQGNDFKYYFAQFLILGIGSAIFIPVAVGLIRNFSILVKILKEKVFSYKMKYENQLIIHAMKIFQVTCKLILFLIIGLPVVTAIQPFVEGFIFSAVLFFGFSYALFDLWRRSGTMAKEISSGSQEIINIMSEQAYPTKKPQILIPGLEKLTIVKIEQNSGLIGKTLLEIDLQANTGSTIVILEKENNQVIVFPEPHVKLKEGDQVFLYGNDLAQKRAEHYLGKGFTLKKAG